MPRLALVPAAVMTLYSVGGWQPPLAADLARAADRATVQDTPPADPTQDAASLAPRRIRRADDGLFYTDAVVNGTRVHFVIDTGSSLVVMTATDAARVGIDERAGRVRGVDTAAGASSMRSTTLGSMAIAGETITNVDGAVMRDNLPVSLLGQSALSRLRSVAIRGEFMELD